jgi:hypothetical protein
MTPHTTPEGVRGEICPRPTFLAGACSLEPVRAMHNGWFPWKDDR